MSTFVERVRKGSKKSKKDKVKKIFTPRPGQDTENACEDDDEKQQQQADLPPWRRHFEADELFGRYEPTRELGRGSYGIVYEGVALKDVGRSLAKGSRIAIKKVRRVFHTDIDAKRLLRELRILRILRNHDSIVRLYDILPPKDPKNFVALYVHMYTHVYMILFLFSFFFLHIYFVLNCIYFKMLVVVY